MKATLADLLAAREHLALMEFLDAQRAARENPTIDNLTALHIAVHNLRNAQDDKGGVRPPDLLPSEHESL